MGVLALAGCDDKGAAPKPEDKPAATAKASGDKAEAPKKAEEPKKVPTKPVKQAKAKAYEFAQELGTLPEGVGIAVGEKAPDFELPSVDGKKVRLSGLTKEKKVLLVFYRGGW